MIGELGPHDLTLHKDSTGETKLDTADPKNTSIKSNQAQPLETKAAAAGGQDQPADK